MSKQKNLNVDVNSYNRYMSEFNRRVNDNSDIITNIDNTQKYDFTLKPGSYDAWEWTKDAYTTWMENRDKTNLSTSEGKLDILHKEENVLNNAEKYMSNDIEMREILQNMNNDPENIEYYYNRLYDLQKENSLLKQDYDIIQSGSLSFQQESPSKELLDSGLKDLAFERQLLEEQKNKAIEDIQYYQDKVNRTNEGWWINTHKVSNYYKNKELSTDIDYTNLDTYLYRVPGLLGSSASSMKSNTLATIAGAASARFAQRGNIVGSAIAGAVSLASNLYARSEESFAELHENYKEKVKVYAKKDGSYKKALENAERQLRSQGVTNLDEDTLLDALVTGKVYSGSENFDKNAINAMTGMEKLYVDNMALAGWDVAQTAIEVTPIGIIAKTISGISNLAKKYKTLNKTVDKLSGIKQQVSDRMRNAVEFGIDNVDKLPKYNLARKLTNVGGRLALSAVSEGIEEGTQYIRGQEFINTTEFEQNPNLFDSMMGNLEVGARSVFAAVTPFDPVYSSDKEFIENFKAGALLGGLMSGIITPLAQYKPIKNKYKADEFVSSLFSDRLKDKDDVTKNILYTKAAKSDNWSDIEDSFNQLRSMNIDGLTEEDIRTEQVRANKLRNRALSPITLTRASNLNIDVKSDDYDKYVALLQYHDDKNQESLLNLRKQNDQIQQILSNPDYLKELNDRKLDSGIFSQLLLDKTRLNQLDAIEQEYKKLSEEFDKMENNGIPTNLSSVNDYINTIQKLKKNIKESYDNSLKESNLSDKDIETSSIHTDLNDAVKKSMYLNIDQNINADNYNILATGSKSAVMEKINKYNEAITIDNTMQEQMQDNVRNIKYDQEDVDIEDIPETPISDNTETIKVESTVETEPTVTEDGLKEEKKETRREKHARKLIDKNINKLTNAIDEGEIIEQLNAINDLERTISEENIATEEELQLINKAKENAKQKGYTISDEIAPGKQYTSGMRAIVDFVIDENLQNGEQIIRTVVKPLIYKNGEMVQAPKIIVAISPNEENKKVIDVDENKQITELRNEILKKRSETVITTVKKEPKSRRQIEKTKTRLALSKVSDWENKTPVQRQIEAEQIAHEDNTYTIEELQQQPDHIYSDSYLGKTYKLAELKIQQIGENIAPRIAEEIRQNNPQYSWKYYDKNGNYTYQYNEEFLSTDIEASDIEDVNIDNFIELRSLKQQLEEAIFDANENDATRIADLLNTKLKELESNENNIIQEQVIKEQVKEDEVNNTRKQEVANTIEPETILTTDENGYNIDVTYDNKIDPFSHCLDYYTYNNTQDARAFAEVSANEDFIIDSNITFDVKDDDIAIIFNYKGKDYVSKLRTEQDLRNDRLFNRKRSADQQVIKDNLIRFRNKIKLLAKQSEQTGKKIIPVGIARTNGIIRNLKDKNGAPINRSLLETPIWGNLDIYDITPSNTQIGISTGSIRNGQVRRGTELWTSKGTSMGAAIWHVEIPHPETGNTKPIDIQLNNKPFDNNTARLILELLLSNEQYYTTKDGITTPFTPKQLLDLIVNNGTHTIVKDKESNKLSIDQIQAKKAKQLFIDNNNVTIGPKTYSISDVIGNKDLQNQIIDYIQNNMHWNINEDLLWQYFGGLDTVNSKHPLYNLKGWFKRTKAESLVIIPNELEFTRKEVGLDSSTPKGISMLGWYIKNNIVQTDFDKLTDASIFIQDIALEDTEVKQHVEKATEKIVEELSKPEEEQHLTIDDYFSLLGPSDDAAANYTNTELNGDVQTIDKESATNWLKKTLGLNDEQIIFSDTILDITKSGLSVMGQAKLDSILLYDLAPEGVEFHEAWHRVSNLLISEKRRQNIYNRYKRKTDRTNAKDTTIDEFMAEDFRQFMLDNQYKFDFEALNWFKKILNFIKMWYKVGDYTLAKLYYNINMGKYSKVQPSKENVERFTKLYSDFAPFEIRGQKFTTITNVSQYNDFLNSLIFVLLNTQNINEYTDINKLDLNLLKRMLVNSEGKAKNPAWQEIYQNFDKVVAKDLRSKLGKLQIKLINKERDQKAADLDAGETEKINVGEHTIASYETSAFDNAPAEVKFFFQTIPSHIYNAEGKKVLEMNPTTGIPKFVDSKKTWNTVLNDLHTITNLQELVDRVNKLAQDNLLYSGVKAKLDSLIAKSKSSDKRQATDAEVLLTKLLTVIRSHKHRFTTGKITKTENGNIIDIIDNTVDIKSKVYPSIWSQYLFAEGGVFSHNNEGQVIFTKDGKDKLQSFINRYNSIMWAFEHNGITKKGTDIKSGAALEQLKQFTSDLFNSIGILIDKGTIEQLLNRTEYGNSEELTYNKLRKLYNSSIFFGGLPNLVDLLKAVMTQEKNGVINVFEHNNKEIRPINIFTNNGFVKELAKAYVEYHANSEELRSLGAQGNLYYPISQNNFASDRVNELNNDLELVNNLRKVKYNNGSRILEQLLNPDTKLALETFVNFRTSDNNDQGRDYFGITDKEDYISKMSMILSDRILFPTIADKKTYHTMKGINLPHERLQFINAKYGLGQMVNFGEDTINQFISYAFAEKDSIEFVMEQVDDRVDENGEYVSKNRIPKSERIKNFHTPNKYKDKNKKEHKVESNGTRFRFLTGVYKFVEKQNKKGEKEFVEEFINFNDPKKTSKENLETAYKEFFGEHISDNQRRWMLNRLLQKRVNAEVDKAVKLGIINSIDKNNSTYGLTNNLLDIREIDKRAKYYRTNDNLKSNAEAYAIYDIIADYTVNSIISVNEIEQLFSGDPAYYKWNYDENGVFDISVDKIKRLGALTSTGTNNRLDFEDTLYTTYTVAELNDHEIGDKQYQTIKNLFIRGNVRSLVKQMIGSEALFDENGKEYTIDELIQKYPEQANLAKIRGKQQAGYDKEINVADAAVYVSPEMYRKMMRQIGEWSSEIEEAFNILTDPNTEDIWESDPETYAKMLEISLKPLKYMAFGTRFENGLNVPYFNKMALFPLFKSIATGDIKALYDRMTDKDNPLDMVMFNSAVKAGSKSPINYYNEDGSINDLNKLVVYKQDFKYLRQQLNTDPHTHEEQMAGTQMLKVGVSNLGMNEYYGQPDSKVKGSEIKQTIFDCMNALSDKGLEKIQKDLFDDNGYVSIEKITKILQEEAEGQDANDNIISGLTLVNGKPMLPISALSDNKWLESIFISYINKRTIDIELPGGAFIQRSAFGQEATQTSVITDNMLGDGKHLNLINSIFSEVEAEYGKDALINENKEEYTEQKLIDKYPELWERVKKYDGSMDSIISINLLKHIIPNYSKMTFQEARKWLIDNNIIGRNAEPLAIGYRIPTQSQASVSALRFVDVFPEQMGDTIVLPEAFTKLTGSDFDVDKFYISRFAFEKGNKVQFDDTKSYAENTENQIKNRMIEMYMKVLLSKDRTDILKLSIDNDTEMVKDVLKDIESVKKTHYPEPFEVYSPSYQEERKAEYTGGKAGIGPMALNNAHHILTQLMGTRMETNTFTTALQLTDLGREFDYPSANKQNGRILSWLSAMINAFVDIAKDPYIVRLNVNPWTYNMTAFLLRTGKGRQTFYFLSQPILKDIAEEVLKTKGKYGVDQTKSASQLEKDAIETVLKKYDPNNTYRKIYESIKDNDARAIEFGDLFETRMIEDEITGKSVESSKLRELILHPDEFENFNREQVRIYYAWKALKPYADDLANLVKYSKIDTKKMGKSFAEQRIFDQGLQQMMEDSRFAEGEVKRFFKDSFLEKKRQNSIILGQNIFEGVLLRNSSGFINTQNNILYRLGRINNASAKILNPIINTMEAYIKSEFFINKMNEDGINVKDLFYGNNSMARRLMSLTKDIYNGKYPDLLASNGEISNGLLTYLIPNISNYNTDFNVPDFIDTSSMFDTDQSGQNDLINYWRELLEHSNNEISTFARDLIYYAFITSGDNTNANSFFKYVPNSWRMESGYAKYIEDKMEYYNSSNSDINEEDIFLNNWQNDDLVKPVKEWGEVEGKDVDGNPVMNRTSFVGLYSKYPFFNSNKPLYNIFIGKMSGDKKDEFAIKPIGFKLIEEYRDGVIVKNSYPIYPPYIKIRMSYGNSPLTHAVYKLVGYQEVMRVGKAPKYYPVYSLINKKGMRYQGHVITELGRSDYFPFNGAPIYNGEQAISSGKLKQDAWNSFTEEAVRKAMYAEFANIRPLYELPSYKDLENISRGYDLSVVDNTDSEFSQDNSQFEQTPENIKLEEISEVNETDLNENTINNDVSDQSKNNSSDFILHSGGAKGADTIWGQIGEQYGVKANHYYSGEKTPNGNMEISEQDKVEGQQKVTIAARQMGRIEPTQQVRNGLLIRDWAQVKYSDAIFAITTMLSVGSEMNYGKLAKIRQGKGGTGYAIQMAINEGKPVYVYDQVRERWFKNINGVWSSSDVPTLTKNFAGIGTREINEKGIQAIRDVYTKTFNPQSLINDVQNNSLLNKGINMLKTALTSQKVSKSDITRLTEQFTKEFNSSNIQSNEEMIGLINKILCSK